MKSSGLAFLVAAGILAGCASQTRNVQTPPAPSAPASLAHARRLLDSALTLQQEGKYALSQVRLSAALAEVSQFDGDLTSCVETGSRPCRALVDEILGAMRNNLPYALDPESPDPDFQYQPDGLALVDSLLPLTDTLPLTVTDSILFYLDQDLRFDIPFERNERVMESIKMFRERIPSHFTRWLGRKSRWERMISEKLAARNMPQDLIYLAMIESGFNVRAASPARAVGIWQFMPATGRRYGLRVDRFVDERRDPIKATDAALSYLSDLYTLFGDWRLAMAAYNCGEGCVGRTIRRAGHNNYWELPLPNETRHYVPRIFAAAAISKAPARHGFEYVPEPENEPVDTFTVQGGIDFRTIAEIVGTSVDSLAHINPALYRKATPPTKDPVVLNLPLGTRPLFEARYAELDKSYRAPDPVRIVHRVRKGETLARIARRYGTTSSNLMRLNHLRSAKVRPGKRLLVHMDDPMGLPVASASSKKKSGTSVRATAPSASSSTARTVHKVRRGETLGTIARKYDVTQAQLKQWNRLKGSSIRAGQVLKIAKSSRSRGDEQVSASSGSARERSVSSQEKASYSRDEKSSSKSARSSSVRYRVRRGETLYEIAQRRSTTVEAIVTLNNLKSGQVRAGQIIRIPAGTR